MDEHKDTAQKEQQAPVEVPPPALPPIDPPQPPPDPNPEQDDKPKKMSKSEKVMVWATCVIAFGTLVSAAAICFQWYEMHTGAADTKNLVGYAQRQADDADKIKSSADKQASAAQQFADTAGLINGNLNGAVTQLQTQAEKMDKARASAEKNATDTLQATIKYARTDQRAYLEVPYLPAPAPKLCSGTEHINIPIGKQPPGSIAAIFPSNGCSSVSFSNTGRTPATDIHPFGNWSYGIPMPIDYDSLPEGVVDERVLANGGHVATFSVTFRPDKWGTESRYIGYYVYGFVQYKDIFGEKRETGFCHFYQLESAPRPCGDGDWFDKRPASTHDQPKNPN